MTIMGAGTVTDGNGNVVATGTVSYEYDPDIQVASLNDGGLQVGAYYTLTLSDGTGWQGLMLTHNDGSIATFNNSNATPF